MDTQELVESRQQLVELIGLSYFLREKRRFLQSKSELSADERSELDALKNALAPATEKFGLGLPTIQALHKNEAGRRLATLIKTRAPLTLADLAQASSMAEFPETYENDTVARRTAYLRALQILELANARELSELESLTNFASAANS
ncbi:MAG: hypothetical protein K1X83_02500 [Oligoflexia bacterium]|nr:hypothetical protein [Oligoflexia bacterium]